MSNFAGLAYEGYQGSLRFVSRTSKKGELRGHLRVSLYGA